MWAFWRGSPQNIVAGDEAIMSDGKNPEVAGEEKEGGFMLKVATFIVDRRNLFFLLFVIALIFCAIASGWVKVENDLAAYLSKDSETRQGIDLKT